MGRSSHIDILVFVFIYSSVDEIDPYVVNLTRLVGQPSVLSIIVNGSVPYYLNAYRSGNNIT